jgi:hypothetical protein
VSSIAGPMSAPFATRAAALPSLAAGLLWVAAWVHLLMAHGTGEVNERRLVFGLTWLDSGRLMVPSLILAGTAIAIVARTSRHLGLQSAALVAAFGLVLAATGATLGFWTQPIGTYEGASRAFGLAASGGFLAMLGSVMLAAGLVLVGIAAVRARVLPGWAGALLAVAGLSTVPWLHESPHGVMFGVAWLALGCFFATAGRSRADGLP